MDRYNDGRDGDLARHELLRRGAVTAGGLAIGSSLGLAPGRGEAMSLAKGEAADTSTLVVAVPEVPTNLDREFSFELQTFDVLQNTIPLLGGIPGAWPYYNSRIVAFSPIVRTSTKPKPCWPRPASPTVSRPRWPTTRRSRSTRRLRCYIRPTWPRSG